MERLLLGDLVSTLLKQRLPTEARELPLPFSLPEQACAVRHYPLPPRVTG